MNGITLYEIKLLSVEYLLKYGLWNSNPKWSIENDAIFMILPVGDS